MFGLSLAQSKRRMLTRKRGFTLTEIITVVTIIIILLGILAPAILSIQRKAKRAETRALFGKLINSLTLYRKDYGAYPDLAGSFSNGDVVVDLNNGEQWKRFAEIMSLSHPDGSAIENPESQQDIRTHNPKYKRYFDLQLSELEEIGGADHLVDAFGNPNIFIVMDANLDGKIDKASLPEGEPDDLRQRIVVFTSKEGNDEYKEIKSWDS